MDTLSHIASIVRKHIDPGQYQVFLFGSRATGQAARWSDYDIGILGKNPLPATVKTIIEEELEESDIPHIVEVVDFFQLPQRFRQVALSGIKKLEV